MEEAPVTEPLDAQAPEAVDAPDAGADPPVGPTVVFLCVHNAGKSQMALGFFRHLAGNQATGISGGSEPADALNPYAIEAMAELGIDIAGERPKRWSDEDIRAADTVVTMGCGDTCPHFPGPRYLDWDFEAPPGNSLDAVRPVRDAIEERVRSLLTDLGVNVDPTPIPRPL